MLNGLIDAMPHFPQERMKGLHLCLIEEKHLAALNRQEIESPSLTKVGSPDRSRDVAVIAIRVRIDPVAGIDQHLVKAVFLGRHCELSFQLLPTERRCHAARR